MKKTWSTQVEISLTVDIDVEASGPRSAAYEAKITAEDIASELVSTVEYSRNAMTGYTIKILNTKGA